MSTSREQSVTAAASRYCLARLGRWADVAACHRPAPNPVLGEFDRL